MPASHSPAPKPSVLLALVCLALLQRLRPAWCAITVTDAGHAEGQSAERLARLATRSLPHFEQALGALTRRGRPPLDTAAARAAAEHALTTELLGVATALLEETAGRFTTTARALVLGAWLRLCTAQPGLTQKRFCAALGLSERTLRAWRARPAAAPRAASAPKDDIDPEPKRPLRRGRFAFDVLLPDTQLGADTTDLSAFGVPLKLLAAQDLGGRDQDLFDAILVDDHESAELVSSVLSQALHELPGAQALSDQGTPYMAAATTDLLEQLEVEHAPQPEATPTAKATLERAFGTVKRIAAPLLSLTDRLARAVPSLRDPELAKAAVKLLMTALLRAYQAGARAALRADRQRSGIDLAELERAAERSRERARATDHSARLLLEHVHAAYGMDLPLAVFRRLFRRYPLEVLRAAEQAFGQQAHRADIKKRAAYFAAVVRATERAYRTRRAREDDEQQRRAQRDAAEREEQQRRGRWHAHPAEWLAHALELIAALWLPDRGQLVADGVGAGTAYVRAALARLLELHGPLTAADTAAGVADAFARAWWSRLGDAGVAAVLDVYWRRVRELPAHPTEPATLDLARQFASAILHRTGPPRRPAPLEGLRN